MTQEIIGMNGRPAAIVLAEALNAAKGGNKPLAISLIQEATSINEKGGLGAAGKKLIELICDKYDLDGEGASDEFSDLAFVPLKSVVEKPGVSLVTCCKNRNENLLKSLATWLEVDGLSEIVIVDWSSDDDVLQAIRAAGLMSKKVRVIRVENEPRWILSYAFNVGFRLARHEVIVKADADITLRKDYLHRNPLQNGTFIAGSWEVAAKGQEHINGFFHIKKSDLLKISGFNEYITTYGWDDDDIYSRMTQSGLRRVCVDVDSLYHIPHDDSLRIGVSSGTENAEEELRGDTLFNIRANRYIAQIAPYWNADREFAPFRIENRIGRHLGVRRVREEMPHVLSDDICSDAKYYATVELLSWKIGPRAYQLQRAALFSLIQKKRLSEISQFDIGVCIQSNADVDLVTRRSILIERVAEVPNELIDEVGRLLAGIEGVSSFQIYVGQGQTDVYEALSKRKNLRPILLNKWITSGGLNQLHKLSIDRISEALSEGAGVYIALAPELELDCFEKPVAPSLKTGSKTGRDKVVIDAQHGLGNRLRAIGSAAAIAEASGRDLVVLWKPDHHCDCEFRDIFEYDGLVVNDLSEVELSLNFKKYNYMEIEEGAIKDEPISLVDGVDVVARAAYVLQHPASHWESENNFIQRLNPTKPIRDLLKLMPRRFDITAHVRMEAGKGLDHNSYDSAENWSKESHDAIHHWREKSHYKNFLTRIDALFRENPNSVLFLAADLPSTYEVFSERYAGRVHYIKRELFDRSREQIFYAVADAIALSRGDRMLGSTWSSFSELAMRMAKGLKKVEMSGTDF